MRKTWRWHAATAMATATPASAYPAVPLAAASTASAPSLTPASSTTSASSAAASVVLPPANGVKINLIECEMKFVLTHTHSSTHTQQCTPTYSSTVTHTQQQPEQHYTHRNSLSLSRRTAVHSFRIVSPNSPRLDKRSQLPNTFSPSRSPSPLFALPLTKDSFDTSTMCRAYFACLRHVPLPLPLPLCSAPLNGLA